MMKLNKIILILIIFLILKELLCNNIPTENFTEKTLIEYDLGKKNYHDARNYCNDKNMILASKEEILAKDIKFNGQDVWTPVRGSANKWMQVGNRYHRHGKIHNPPPSWGTSNVSYPFKKKFYCTKREGFQGFNLGTNNYNDARKHCNNIEMNLASKEEILAKDIKFNGQDVWTPIKGSDNKWMQIGNRFHKYGKLHNPPPSWGTSNVSYPFKKKFYCSKRNIIEYPLGTNNYNDAKKHCSNMGMKLASKEEILREDIKFNGQDVWTPVRGNDNKWMQIGNRYHKYGKIHNPPPSWGYSNSNYPFKKTFYCGEKSNFFNVTNGNNYQNIQSCGKNNQQLSTMNQNTIDLLL